MLSRVLWLLLAYVSAFPVLASDTVLEFDIQSQPLLSALKAFTNKTGVPTFVDEASLRGFTSTPIVGRLSPRNALNILLSGTGFAPSYTKAGAVTLVFRDEVSKASWQKLPEPPKNSATDRYFDRAQAALWDAICARADEYAERVAFQLWISADGAVQAVHVLGEPAKYERYRSLIATLRTAKLPAHGGTSPQSLTFILTSARDGRSPCRDAKP